MHKSEEANLGSHRKCLAWRVAPMAINDMQYISLSPSEHLQEMYTTTRTRKVGAAILLANRETAKDQAKCEERMSMQPR